MEHYVNIVKKNIDSILSYTRYLGSRRLFYEEQLYRTTPGIKAACNNPDAARCQSFLPLQGSAENRQRKKKALCRKSGCKKR
jgi:hypothetical protein